MGVCGFRLTSPLLPLIAAERHQDLSQSATQFDPCITYLPTWLRALKLLELALSPLVTPQTDKGRH